MVLQLSNPLFIPKILDLAKVIKEMPLDVLEKMLLSGINDKDTVIYIDERNGEVRGCIFASKEKWNGEDVAFIQFCSVRPIGEENYICFELLTKVRVWAKDNDIQTLVFTTKRNPRLFERKYGFKYEGAILKRSVL